LIIIPQLPQIPAQPDQRGGEDAPIDVTIKPANQCACPKQQQVATNDFLFDFMHYFS